MRDFRYVMRDLTGYYISGIFQQRSILVKKFHFFGNCQLASYAVNDIVVTVLMNHYKNVLKVLGCCLDLEIPAIIYEVGINYGLLYDLLYIKKERDNIGRSLSWSNRLKIARDVANALVYLHTAFPTPIIHRDLTTKSIVIDNNGVAKLVDFSLFVALPPGESQVEVEIVGMFGHFEPDYITTGIITEKSDVYMFGIILLQLLTALDTWYQHPEGPENLVGYVQNHVDKNEFDLDIVIVNIDVKRWLAELRGKDMPESFSWSYKRRYRTGYIWQDLLDDDLITPISDNEYVLKGSEISSPTLKFDKDHSYTQKVSVQKEPLSPEEIKGHKPSCIQIHSETSTGVSTKTPSEIEEESPTFGSETSTLTDDSGNIERDLEKKSDTLKQVDMHGSTDQEQKLPYKEIRNENRPSSYVNPTPSSEDKTTTNSKVPMEKNSALTSPEASFTKNKSCSNGKSNIFKNLISCGAVDSNDSAVVKINRKNKPFLNMCSSDQNNVLSAEICKRDKLGGSQTIFGTSWNQQQCNGRKSCDGVKDSRKQCGKSFKPEKLHSHMKSCRGMKALAKGASNPSLSASIVQTTSQRLSSKESQNKDSVSGYYIST
ncbi:unnamed protein product [Fraxinus pennsylvanica]|uniref:Protein kinase domain-containing protein n=1 Tax=Fraxinus pennsylvanica TaxID=56036 RepID=A0AAD1Z8I6_9LAMI|nr:unnamed protein product [Fraxinus pennsylvanica]